MKPLALFLLLTVSAMAQDYILAVKAPWTNAVPLDCRVLDFSGFRKDWSEELKDYMREHNHNAPTEYPALLSPDTELWEPVTNGVDEARSKLAARVAEVPPVVKPKGVEKPLIEALKGLKGAMTNSIAQAQAIDPSVFTGAQKTQIQAIRKTMIDNAQAVNDLRKELLRFYKVEQQ